MSSWRLRFLIVFALSLLLLLLTAGYVFAEMYEKPSAPKKSAIPDFHLNPSAETVPPPGNFTYLAGDNRVDLHWDVPDYSGVKGFLVYRWLEGEVPAVIAGLPGDSTGWSDLTASNGTKYFYLVVTIGANAVPSDVEAQAIATPLAPPPPPPPEPVLEYEEEYYDYYPEEPAEEPAPVVPLPVPPPNPGDCPLPPAPGGG